MPNRRRGAPSPDRRVETRPLPAKPSLEYERKQAKALLRELQSGSVAALARARAQHESLDRRPVDKLRLADAQLVIAREYGFASWPKLVQYFREVERQTTARHSRSIQDVAFYEQNARSLIARHQRRQPNAGRVLTASVPRFYGLTVEQVFDSPVSVDEARLAVARQMGCASWEVLMEVLAAERTRRGDPWLTAYQPLHHANRAINAGDLDAVKQVVSEHPELLQPSAEDRREFLTVIHAALAAEQRGVSGAREITEWLATEGVDVQIALNERLMDFRSRPKQDEVRWLLERGADPNWIAPNSVSVIEYALLRYWNGDAVDVLARHITPKPALWIVAGLGRVADVSRFLDAHGKPMSAAYHNRPDFAAVGLPMLSASCPDPEEVLAEAFFVAMLNDRIEVLDYLIDRGFPIDYLGWEMPFINFAVGNRRVRVVECLVRRGANLDLRGRHPDQSAREVAQRMVEQMPQDHEARAILSLCDAGDADRVIAEYAARPAPEPIPVPVVDNLLALAADDAARRGQREVIPENLVIGMLRAAMDIFRFAKLDMDRLHAELGTRVLPVDDRVERVDLPMSAAARDVIRAATELAREAKEDVLTPMHVLRALIESGNTFLASLPTSSQLRDVVKRGA